MKQRIAPEPPHQPLVALTCSQRNQTLAIGGRAHKVDNGLAGPIVAQTSTTLSKFNLQFATFKDTHPYISSFLVNRAQNLTAGCLDHVYTTAIELEPIPSFLSKRTLQTDPPDRSQDLLKPVFEPIQIQPFHPPP